MPTNPYFNHFHNQPEKDLLHDLIIESIQNYGIELYYIKKTTLDPKTYNSLMGESPGVSYKVARKIEGYVKDFDGYQGEGHLATKFGMEIRNQLTFSLSIKRWQEEAIEEREERPFEGDIIFFPLSKEWFEIKFVQDASIFYQVGEFAIYDCICEQFNYNHQNIEMDEPTGEEYIDDFEGKTAYSIVLDIDSSGSSIDYLKSETVYQGNSLEPDCSAKVVSWDRTTGKLKLTRIIGEFKENQIVHGEISKAEHTYILPEISVYLKRSSTKHVGSILFSDGTKIKLSATEIKDPVVNTLENQNISNDNAKVYNTVKDIIIKRNNPFLS